MKVLLEYTWGELHCALTPHEWPWTQLIPFFPVLSHPQNHSSFSLCEAISQPAHPHILPHSLPSSTSPATSAILAEAHQKWSSYRAQDPWKLVLDRGQWQCWNRSLCLRAGVGISTGWADQEHKWSSRHVPAQAKPWPIGCTGEGGKELGIKGEA